MKFLPQLEFKDIITGFIVLVLSAFLFLKATPDLQQNIVSAFLGAMTVGGGAAVTQMYNKKDDEK